MPNPKAMYRSLESLHRAGVSWPEALRTAAPGRLARAQTALQQGKPLSEALHDEVDALDVALIRAGESSGSLEGTFARLAQRHEDEARQRREIKAALLYPIILGHLGAFLLAVPDLIAGRTTAAIGWAAAILVPCWLFIFLGRRSTAAARAGDPVPPRFVNFLNESAIEEADARSLLALGDCLNAAVPLPETLRLAARAGAGGRVAADLAQAAIGVPNGKPISAHYRHTPEEVARALTVAEQAGDLSDVAHESADALRFDAQMRREKIRAVMPVVMMLTIGGLIAYKVISFYAGAMRFGGI